MKRQLAAYVEDADRMVVAAGMTPDGLWVRFADGREGVIPFGPLKLPGEVERVSVPNSYVIHLHMPDGGREDVPWDFARHFADPGYRRRSEAAAERDRRLVGEKLRAVRAMRALTQQELAERAGVSRVTIARIETGERLPRFDTLSAIGRALAVPLTDLLADDEEA